MRRAHPESMSMDAGFTLVELIMTMIIVGILALMVLPRFMDISIFEARGFRDETLSLLRYAQKSAIAQRRTVCVTVNPDGVTLEIDTAATPDGVCDGPSTLTLPTTPRGGSGLGSTSATFNFLASGAASNDVILTITDAADINVDAATGYVR